MSIYNPFKINKSKPPVISTWGEPYEEARGLYSILRSRKMLLGMGFEIWIYQQNKTDPTFDEQVQYKLYIRKKQ